MTVPLLLICLYTSMLLHTAHNYFVQSESDPDPLCDDSGVPKISSSDGNWKINQEY